jgi:hypothetical protein
MTQLNRSSEIATADIADQRVTEIDEPSIIDIVAVLIRGRRTISYFVFAGLLIGAASGLLRARQFSVTSTFIPTSTDQSASNGFALAASQLGIRVPQGGGGWGAPVYVELLTTRDLLGAIAADSVKVAEDGYRWIAVADLLKVEAASPAERLERTVQALRLVVSAAEIKRLGAVQLSVSTRWPSVSLALANRLLSEINRFNLQTRQSQASAERAFAESQTKEAARTLREAEDRMQFFLQRNRVAGSAELTFEQGRLQREITVRQQAYSSLLQSYTEARLREVRDTPVITVLVAPSLPLIGEPRRTVLKAAVGAMIGVVFGMLWVLLLSARNSPGAQIGALFEAVDEALPPFLRRR